MTMAAKAGFFSLHPCHQAQDRIITSLFKDFIMSMKLVSICVHVGWCFLELT